jgi:hypothetical protein
MIASNNHVTSLMEIRRFLTEEKAAPAPWAAPQTSVESLYALLVARRDDAVFWSRLRILAMRLEDNRVNLSRIRHSEALGYATVDKLLSDLRADLLSVNGPARISWKQVLSGSLRATSLAAFLLLGTATASCGDDDDGGNAGDASADTDTDTDTDADGGTALCDEAIAEELVGEEGQVFCDLVEIVNSADLSGEQRAALLDCLPNLDAAFRETLLETFESMSDTEIAAHLSQMLGSGGICYEDTEGGH